MEYQKFSGKNVEEALTNASVTFGVTSDKIEYEIVEKGSSGIFGFASKDAIINAKIKKENKENKEPKVKERIKEEKNIKKEEISEILNESKAKKSPKKIDEDTIEEIKELATNFITGVCEKMNIEVSIKFFYDEVNNSLNIELSGDDMGTLIGKRGGTLDSLQYLTNLVINRKIKEFIHITIDTEKYRERRKKTLENLAKNVAFKVKRTKKPVSLESMNSYERRVIHSALSNDPVVTTHSEGEDPYRHVVVTLK